jgi:sulfide dehydrogenase cytochrome subunit
MPGCLCRLLRTLGLALLVPFAAAPVAAQEAGGDVLSESCLSCHGANGRSPGAIPSLDKLSAAEMDAKLHAFAAGTVEATIMGRIARGYTDTEIAALTAWLAGSRP